jgi:STAS-like domain of unknown function (DUF4325)
MKTSALCEAMHLVKEHGEVLGGRVLGEEVRVKVARLVEEGEVVTLDLDGVVAVSPSFADEVFGKLPAEVGDEHIEFVNLSAEIQAVADMARAGRSSNSPKD